jgi:hypothetical protein
MLLLPLDSVMTTPRLQDGHPRREPGAAEEGLFAPRTAFSRLRVQAVYVDAVVGATDAPRRHALAAALGRQLYLVHLAVLLWWLLDKSPGQRATDALVKLLERVLRMIAPSLGVPGVAGIVTAADELVRDALFSDQDAQAAYEAGQDPHSQTR